MYSFPYSLTAGGPCAVDRSLLTDPHFRLGLPAPWSQIWKICYASEGAHSKFISAHKSGKFVYASEGALSKFISTHLSTDALRARRLKETLYAHRHAELPVVLVANKSDLLTARAVTEDEGLDLAAEMDCPKYELSVAEGFAGVGEAMEELLCQLKREYVKSVTGAGLGMASSQSSSSSSTTAAGMEKRSRLYHMKKAFKKRIVRSRSDTF